MDEINAAKNLARRCLDTELEAISEAWLGKIHYRGIKKDTSKARSHLVKSI